MLRDVIHLGTGGGTSLCVAGEAERLLVEYYLPQLCPACGAVPAPNVVVRACVFVLDGVLRTAALLHEDRAIGLCAVLHG